MSPSRRWLGPLSRRWLGSLAVVALVLLLGAGIYLGLPATADEEGDEVAVEVPDGRASSGLAVDPAQPVVGVPAVRDTLWISVTAAGEVESVRRAALTARVEGFVREIWVLENQLVRQGELLVRLDTTEFALAVARARADLRSAEAQHRQMVLFDDEIQDPELRAERDRVARARSGLDQAEVALEEAELNLRRTAVRAPFDGRVANLRAVEGALVSQGQELLEVVALDPVRVEVRVLEGELPLLQEGRRATASLAAFPGERFRGRIHTLNPVVDPETRTGRVTLHLPNPYRRLRPGMYARVSLEARAFPDRVLVPREAILERDRRTMLFVHEEGEDGAGGRAKWRYVSTGLENDSLVELVPDPETGMVERGEVVLVDGHRYLVHDARVRLVERLEGDGAPGGGRP